MDDDAKIILEYQLLVLAYQWLVLHPEATSITFRVDPETNRSIDMEVRAATARKPKR